MWRQTITTAKWRGGQAAENQIVDSATLARRRRRRDGGSNGHQIGLALGGERARPLAPPRSINMRSRGARRRASRHLPARFGCLLARIGIIINARASPTFMNAQAYVYQRVVSPAAATTAAQRIFSARISRWLALARLRAPRAAFVLRASADICCAATRERMRCIMAHGALAARINRRRRRNVRVSQRQRQNNGGAGSIGGVARQWRRRNESGRQLIGEKRLAGRRERSEKAETSVVAASKKR